MENQFNRRTFVKSLTIAGAGMALSGPRLFAEEKNTGDESVRRDGAAIQLEDVLARARR